MAKEQKIIMRKRLLRLYVSSVLSISLLLFLIGFFAVLALGARNLSNFFKENIRITAILADNTSESEAEELGKELSGTDFVRNLEVVSKERGTAEMKELLGEDFLDIFESNPIPVTLNIFADPAHFTSDSIKAFRENLLENSLVQDVIYQEDVVESVNKNLRMGGLVFLILGVLLLFISTVLINNTVRLNIFSKRFAVHTMQLVGATKGFIQRPFLQNSLIQGLVSALIAILALLAVAIVARGQFALLFEEQNAIELVLIGAGLILLGVFLCFVSTWIVVRKMLGMRRSDLYY